MHKDFDISELNKLSKTKLKDLGKIDLEKLAVHFTMVQSVKSTPYINRYKAKDLYELEYGEVVLIKQYLTSPDTKSIEEVFKIVFECPSKLLYDHTLNQYFGAMNWVVAEIEQIQKQEVKQLSREPSDKMKIAGIHRLNIFGELNVLVSLAKEFNTTPQEVEKWTYSTVFALILRSNIEAEITNELQNQK